ncbi:abortive phage infection protein [Janthinobacterium sp. BJB412]|nr:abortive phage infection protein [Janthinobacterium sp. BJB412]
MSTDLAEFLSETQADVRAQMSEGSPYAELVFSEVVMHHMAEIGMTFEPVVCHFQGKVGNAVLRLSGYAMSDDADQLDLFVSLYKGVDEPTSVPDADNLTALQQCLKFLTLCAEGKMAPKLDPSSDVHSLALNIHAIYNDLEQIRVFILTDCVAKAKSFKTREIGGKSVRLEVMDIERLHRHWSEGKPRDELVVDFAEVSGSPLPCVYVPGTTDEYDYALTAIPGEALRFLYERFGARLLEANVRSFLSVKGKGVNSGIQGTLRSAPGRFMAYNNGIVIVADEMRLGTAGDGSPGVAWLRGLQIVNGGQTTASIYFAKKKFPDTDLSKVRVPAKIIVMKEQDPTKEEALISDISRFANTQNVVRQSDLSANKPFHVDVERLSLNVICPDGVGRWFYERAAGSYNTLLAREGTTPAKLRALKDAVPPGRKITKTDLAKYLMAWGGHPDTVSFGSQKCFDRFMSSMTSEEDTAPPPPPDVNEFKLMVAKAIVFKKTQSLVRPMFQAFQANVAAYTVSMLATVYGNRFDLARVWERQSVSPELLDQLAVWSREVNDVLHQTASGRMVSEWAKKSECRDAVFAARYSDPAPGIPEFH